MFGGIFEPSKEWLTWVCSPKSFGKWSNGSFGPSKHSFFNPSGFASETLPPIEIALENEASNFLLSSAPDVGSVFECGRCVCLSCSCSCFCSLERFCAGTLGFSSTGRMQLELVWARSDEGTRWRSTVWLTVSTGGRRCATDESLDATSEWGQVRGLLRDC